MSRKLIEAALFMSSRPMSAEEISKITGVTPGNVGKMLEVLCREYAGEAKGVEIIRSPEGWEMRVKPELLPKVAHLTPYSDLRDGHKRTLALVAYKEPVKQSEVVRIQGNKAYSYIKFLRKKGLIKSEKEGRTMKLMVTKEFERYFGLEKERIKEMLNKGMERAKAREEAKATAAAKEEADAKAAAKASAKPAKEEAKTPPTNFQYIEMKPASPLVPVAVKTKAETRPGVNSEAKTATKPKIKNEKPGTEAVKTRLVKRKSKRLPPAAKIGTRRPGD